MKISSQEEYGLRCLLRLAQAEEGSHTPTIPEIAAGEGLSAPYVAKLLAVLRQGGLIDSVRGRAGGYRLAAPLANITLAKVLAVLGEPLFDETGYCERHKGSESDGGCVHLGACNLRAVWHTLDQWMHHAFDQITLADLMHGEGHITELMRRRLAESLLDSPMIRRPLSVVESSG